MNIDGLKKWLGPILAVLYMVCYNIVFSPLRLLILQPHMFLFIFLIHGLVEILSFPPSLLLVLLLCYLLYHRVTQNKIVLLIFIISFLFSSVTWSHAIVNGLHIDYVLSFLIVTPYDLLYSAIFGIANGYAVMLYASALLLTLSILIVEYMSLLEKGVIESHKIACILFVITVVWSFLPGFLLQTHQQIESFIPLPFGPILAMISLPIIENHWSWPDNYKFQD